MCGRSCPVCSGLHVPVLVTPELGLARVVCLRGQLRRSYWSFTSRIVTKPDQSVVGSAGGGGTIVPALLRMSKKLGGRPSAHLRTVAYIPGILPTVSLFLCWEQIADRLVARLSRSTADSTCVRRLIA